ncbi:MAG: alkaline phosphatase family protein [Candidatus Eisenbacteria bacterium]|nr:alkaline phosphatase family protein [Candidatus Eisenbacteria bacterium]
MSDEERVTRDELMTEFQNNLRVGLLTGSIGGILLGLLYAAATLVLNPELLRSGRDVIVLVLGLIAVYTVFCLALGLIGALGKTLLFRSTGRHISDTKTAAFVTGAVFFSVAALYGYQWCRWHRIGGLSPETYPGPDQLPILITVIAVAGLLARLLTYAFYLLIVHFKKPERAQPGDLKKAFLVLAYMAGAFGIFVLALRLGNSGTSGPGAFTRDDVGTLEAPVRVLAVDGIGAADVARLTAEGRLGPLAALLSGKTADVPAPEHPVAPVIWTRVATGQPLEAHGIVDYQAQVVRGLSRPFTVGANQVGLFQLFQDVFPFFRLTRPVPMRSYMRGSKGIWNIATDAGRTCDVINWWVSYPAESVKGSVVSDNTYLRLRSELSRVEDGVAMHSNASESANALTEVLDDARLRSIRPQGETYPGSLLLELAPALRPDSSVVSLLSGAEAHLESLQLPSEVLRADLFYAQSAMYLLGRDHPDLWLLHLPGPDVFRRVLRRDVADQAARDDAYSEALDAYWSVLVPVLTPLVDETATGTSATRTVWLSLPGWPLEDTPSGTRTGWFGISGLSVGTGTLEPIPIESLCPTLLWLLGLPYSEEMLGSPATGVVADTTGLGSPRQIAAFGPLVPPNDPPVIDPQTDQERLELLRSLGYIDD